MSNLIPREFINELLSRCDLIELIDARVPLKKKGGNYAACCPFHNEKTPSFTVSPSKQIYHCFGCQVSGNAIGFLMEFDRLTFVEAIEQLAKELGMLIPKQVSTHQTIVQPDLYQTLEQAAIYYQKQLREHPQAIDYLKNRGLSGKIAKQFAIGYAPAGWDGLLKQFNNTNELLAAGLIGKKKEGGYYDRFRDRIMFPIRDRRGRTIAFGGRTISNEEPKYLNSPETTIFHKGNELYGIFEAVQVSRNIPRLLVVEGYMDVVALAQHNISYAVATLGTATTAEHIQRLFRMTTEVIFCFDGDSAGQTAAWRAMENVLSVLQDGWQVRFLLMPEGEDPDSLIRKIGTEEFVTRLNQTTSLADFFFQTLSKSIDLATVEGKAKLTKLVIPLLNKIPDNIYKHMLFDRLAQLVRMDVATIKSITQPKIKKQTAAPFKKANKALLHRSAMRIAIALLVQNPNLAQSLTNISEINQLTLPGSDLLQEIISQVHQASDLNTGRLLEYWRDRPEGKQVEQLAIWETGVPSTGVEAELLGVIVKLLDMHHQQKTDALMQKARLQTISEEEKKELQQLISGKNRE